MLCPSAPQSNCVAGSTKHNRERGAPSACVHDCEVGGHVLPIIHSEGESTLVTWWQQALIAALVGYLFGSIPTGMVVARIYRNVDLTAHGSGRTGATNVLRTLGRGAAAVAFA